MKNRVLIRTSALLLALLWAGSLTAADYVRYKARPGSSVKIDGTSTIHDWTVTSGLIGGYMDIDADFPLDPAQNPPAGKVDAKVDTFLMVSSLKSGKKAMDEVMYDTMERPKHPKISYELRDLVFKKADPEKGELHFDATGALTVHGTTITNQMPVVMIPKPDDKLLVKGTAPLKMTDFGMKTPAPSIGLGLIKTGDEVKVHFEWVTAKAD